MYEWHPFLIDFPVLSTNWHGYIIHLVISPFMVWFELCKLCRFNTFTLILMTIFVFNCNVLDGNYT